MTALHLENGVIPLVDTAYRQGAVRNPKKQKPRDMVVTFLIHSAKNMVLKVQQWSSLKFSDQSVVFLQDLSSETLMVRKLLKPITSLLSEATQCYRWASLSTLQVKSLLATDLESGLLLLQALNLDMPRDANRRP